MTILDHIIAHKKIEVAERKKSFPISTLEKEKYFSRKTISLVRELKRNNKVGIIAEFKRKSPSKQNINQNSDIRGVVEGYDNAGVSGVSILTDEKFFGGKNSDLITARNLVNIPVLRKEFIVDEYQIIEAKAIGADVILLIAAVLEQKKVKALSSFAKNLGLEILLEVHNKEELEKSLNDNIDIVGVNNRNLKTFEVSIENSLQLSKFIPANFLKISESGLEQPEDIIRLKSSGFNGFLIGEKFMKTKNPAKSCADFVNTLTGFQTLSGLTIRSSNSTDLPAIEKLAHKIWNEVYPGIISQKQIDYMLEKMYSQQSMKKQITEEKHEYTLAFENENMIGYLDTSTEDGENFFMHKLYFDTSFHGKGVAKQLFDFVYSQKKNIKAIRLQVNRKNLQAINFYKKLGFNVEYEKDFDIGDCFYMCDFVMIKKY